MELLDKLRLESESEHVAYTEFILKLRKRSNCVFYFFEGKDDYKYYGARIKNYTLKEFEPITCGGKDKVIAVEKLISKRKEYTNIQTCFFIDKDYQTCYDHDKIYCLPSYSIENQYVNVSTLQSILKHEFSIDEDENDYDLILNKFHNLKSKFHSETLVINAWLACQSDIRAKQNKKTYLKIESKIGSYFNSIVSLDLSSIKDFSDLQDIDKIQSLFAESPIVSEKIVNAKLLKIKQEELEKTLRGKFQLKFFTSFLDRLKSEICKKGSQIFEKKRKCSLRFEYATALTNLSIYAQTPDCLYDYLKRKIKNAA